MIKSNHRLGLRLAAARQYLDEVDSVDFDGGNRASNVPITLWARIGATAAQHCGQKRNGPISAATGMIERIEREHRRWHIAFTGNSLGSVLPAVEAGLGVSVLTVGVTRAPVQQCQSAVSSRRNLTPAEVA